MVNTQMTCNAAQIHPIYVHFQGFTAYLLVIGPRLGFRCVFNLAVHATITLAAAACFSRTVLSFCSMAFWTAVHSSILAQLLATPYVGEGCIIEFYLLA